MVPIIGCHRFEPTIRAVYMYYIIFDFSHRKKFTLHNLIYTENIKQVYYAHTFYSTVSFAKDEIGVLALRFSFLESYMVGAII